MSLCIAEMGTSTRCGGRLFADIPSFYIRRLGNGPPHALHSTSALGLPEWLITCSFVNHKLKSIMDRRCSLFTLTLTLISLLLSLTTLTIRALIPFLSLLNSLHLEPSGHAPQCGRHVYTSDSLAHPSVQPSTPSRAEVTWTR